jgi:arylsulfatase A-like enzyme
MGFVGTIKILLQLFGPFQSWGSDLRWVAYKKVGLSEAAHRTKRMLDDIESVPSGSDRSIRFLVEVAIWFGLLSGLTEVSILTLEHRFWHPIMRLSRDYVWMAPLAEVTLFMSGAICLFVLSRLWRRLDALALVVFVCSLLAFLNLLMLIPRLHHAAALVLAIGLGAQTVRMVSSHAAKFRGLIRHTLVWMVGLAVLLGLGVQGWQLLKQRQALAQLSPVPSSAPNVLVITLDTVRAANLSLYGYSRATTPQLERIAQTGVIFDRALAAAPWTLPSHASMFTGRYPHELSTDYTTPLDATYPTLAEFFRARGYATAGLVANYGYCSYETGLARGFLHYEDYPRSLGQIASSSTLIRTVADNFRLRRLIRNDEHLNRKSAAQLNHDFLSWLARENGRPFFVFLNYFDAHEPYLPPPPFDKKFGPGRKLGKYSPVHRHNWEPGLANQPLSAEQVKEEIDAYDGAIAYLDQQIGFLFDTLEQKSVLKNTLIIIAADHGEEFGEHGIFDHGYTLYLSGLHVPLLISFPGRVPSGRRVATPVSLRNLAATIVELTNLGGGAAFNGLSLSRYWANVAGIARPEEAAVLSEVKRVTNRPDWFPASKGDMQSLILDRYHYIKDADGREELYDIETDPWEKNDLAGSERSASRIGKFRDKLRSVFPLKRAS